MSITKDDMLGQDIFTLLQHLEFEAQQRLMYKIGAKVRSKINGQEFYVIGLKTIPSTVTHGQPIKQLIVHLQKGVPTRMGFPVYLDQMVYVGD